MTDYITKTGTTTYSKNFDFPHDRSGIIVAKCSHNAAATAVPASNVVNMIAIPAESVVLSAQLLVTTNQANTDFKIGVTADDDVFSAATALDANGTIVPTTIGTMQGAGYYTNAATNITVTAITNAVNAAIVTLVATYVKLDAVVTT